MRSARLHGDGVEVLVLTYSLAVDAPPAGVLRPVETLVYHFA